ncbi:MAG: allophanate hydrolase [Porticoccaceae bacterium]
MDLVTMSPATPTGAPPLPDLHRLRRALADGLTAQAVIEQVIARRRAVAADGIWITQVPDAALRERARQLDAGPRGPLFGVPFAVKDNIDVAGLPTTAACPAFAYSPETTAPAVQKLLDAGAILVGKTNLDQFATGLTGTRTPYGAPANAFDADYICGGSSSGSALAVTHGLVSFALGTDTAGSGRVPAALGNLIGLKPSRGLVSTRGVLPACRSLDCVSVFALTCGDAHAVLEVIAGVDTEDPFSRVFPPAATTTGPRFRFGIPQPAQRQFFADSESLAAFEQAIDTLVALGGDPVEVDYAPFHEAARLLYEGPWLAERRLALGDFLDRGPDAVLPVVREIILGADRFTAADLFAAEYRLLALSQMLRAQWQEIDLLVTPTIPTPYTRAAVLADPLTLNDRLGYYTNHVNLLDLCAVAVPAGFLPSGLPFGVTLQAPAGRDRALLVRADRLHRAINATLGATGLPLADTAPMPEAVANPGVLALAVCGGHMQGLPLNHELTDRGARLVERTQTAPAYRLYALAGFSPPRPGLLRNSAGASIEVEVWTLPLANVGTFLAGVPAPLVIGSVELADGSRVKGFLCEGHAIAGAQDITALGGWRAWLASA